MKYILDTNTIIYFLKGTYPSIEAELKRTPAKDILIPSIVLAELEYGAQNSQNYEKNIGASRQFTSAFEIIPFSVEAAKEYGQIRYNLKKSGTPIGGNDLIIAASAKSIGATVVTHNLSEFSRVEGLDVVDWVNYTLTFNL